MLNCLLRIFIAFIAGVLGVGAVDASDMLTGFSSRGTGGYKNKSDTTPAVVRVHIAKNDF